MRVLRYAKIASVPLAQLVEHVIGNDEVSGLNPGQRLHKILIIIEIYIKLNRYGKAKFIISLISVAKSATPQQKRQNTARKTAKGDEYLL